MNKFDVGIYKHWFQMALDDEIGVGNFLEFIIQLVYSSILMPGDIAIDGGANRGMHTIPIGRIVGKKGIAIGFEAIPKLASDLESKTVSHGMLNIKVKSLALGDKIGFADFHYIQQCDYRSGIKERQGVPENFKDSAIKIRVPLSTMDNEVEFHNKVRFIKLDLEGGEYHALMGAERIMTQDRPFIVFENGREASAIVYGYSRSEWFSLFEARGYTVFDIFGRKFNVSDWDKYDRDVSCIPWYFIAVSRESDKLFVADLLPNLIETLFMALVRVRRMPVK